MLGLVLIYENICTCWFVFFEYNGHCDHCESGVSTTVINTNLFGVSNLGQAITVGKWGVIC